MGAEQAIAVAENRWKTVQHLSAHVPRKSGAKFHGLWWLRCNIPAADSKEETPKVYQGPVPLMISPPPEAV